MSPSASFGDDGSAEYEPTMSPGAFQAAMAAGMAAQGAPAAAPKQEESRVHHPDVTPHHSAASAVHEHSRDLPVLSIGSTGAASQDKLPTLSSVASNSAASMPAAFRPAVSASCRSEDASCRYQGADATPTSKPTQAAGTATSQAAVEEAAEDPASPCAEPSSHGMADSIRAVLNTCSLPSATGNEDSCKLTEPSHAGMKHALLETAISVIPKEIAQGQTPDTHATAECEPASTQLAEIADASGQADDSELSTAVQPAVDGAESAPPQPSSHAGKAANSRAASTATSAAADKGLFSAVSKRPAEVCNLTLCSSTKALPNHGTSNKWHDDMCICP